MLNLLRLLHANCLKITFSETWPSVGHLLKSHRISINMWAAEICRLCSQQDLREAMCNIFLTYVSPSLTPAPFSLNFHLRKHFRMFARLAHTASPRTLALVARRVWGRRGGYAGAFPVADALQADCPPARPPNRIICCGLTPH